ncbi:MAG: DUF6807 family protein [Chloroherpetonaceae bacterium]|nr:PmoA family protein [Chthonomonadaceae bacterium]MDW8209158.1 DUF6807 family protein [Chloroherpetonaceae bacterium]
MRPALSLQVLDRRIRFFVRGNLAAEYRYDVVPPEWTCLNAPERRTVLVALRHARGFWNGALLTVREAETLVRRGAYSLGFQQTFLWHSPEYGDLLTETCTARVAPGPCDGFLLDLTLMLHAQGRMPLTSVPDSPALLTAVLPSALLPDGGGQIRNGEGLYGIETLDGRASAWTGATGVIYGETVGVIWLDHPDNPCHPPVWRVDAHGQIAPCPFLERPLSLPPSATLRWRYRILVHRGYVEQGWAGARLQEFARTPAPA